MYYDDDDDDDDPYAPRIGPAAMPSPRSRFAPYYSGYANTFEDFLEDFEGRAYDCALTDPQRVDTLVRYVDPTLRELCRTFDGFRSRNWSLFRQSLVNVFGNPTPRHQIMRQKLRSYVQDSSRTRMYCEDDVLQYYRQFIRFGLPLVHAGHLSEEERDAAFLYGFHPLDREVLRPRLLGKHPLQPLDIPFHFEDVFGCARAAFAYDDYFPSPWSHAKQFEPSSVRREQLVVEPILRDAYSFREVTRVVASNAETTTIPDELPSISPSPYSSPDTQLPSSSSPSASESQQTQAPSVTLDQPEPAYTLSATLPPSDSPSSYTPTLVYSATDNDLIPVPTFPITTSTLRPSAPFPTPPHTSSLVLSAADDNPEIPSTLPLSSITLTPSSIPSISPDFDSECLPLVTEDQFEPEPTPTLFASIPTLPSASSHVRSATDYVLVFASTPPSSSPTSSTCLPSVTEEQPEPEPEPIPLIAPASTFASTPLSSSSPTFLPTPVTSVTDDQPEHAPLSSITPTSPCLPAPSLALEFTDDVHALSSLPLPEMSTLDSLPLILSLDQSSSSSGSLSQLSSPCEFESTPVSAADVVTLNPESPEFSESESSQGESISFPPASLEAPPIAPISPHSTPPQRPPGSKTVDSDSFLLEITPSLASSVPQQSQELSLVYEAASAFAPRPSLLHSSPLLLSSGPSSVRFNFAFVFITTEVLVSTLFDILATTFTLAHKYWSKQEDFGNSQISTLNTSSRDVFAQQLRLGQLTPRAPRLVFDPGGPASSSRLFGTRRRSQAQVEDTQRLLRHARRHPYSHSSRQSHRFDPGGGAFVLEPAHEDSATFDEEDVQ
ncbi:hypothetical protein EDB84DRAFT_1575483 [Lactarius hengduanensis]|nr:hypothetical protein EDB84DRAFT_1575483 [Lactarius hengduanensis]